MYCLCVNVYCHRVTTQLQLINISYHIISYSILHFRSIDMHRRYITCNSAVFPISQTRNSSNNLVCLTLVDLQLDAQNSYLFTYNTFIKILYMFRSLPCSSSGGLRRNCIYAASGIVTLCRWSCLPVEKELFFLNWCTGQSSAESDDTRRCIYTIAT